MFGSKPPVRPRPTVPAPRDPLPSETNPAPMTPATECAAKRERIATFALSGLLAAGGDSTSSNADRLAVRAVRYADALIAALNASTARQLAHREPSPYHME